MRALILTYGTRGDVQPFAALADELHSAGHEVVSAVPARLSPMIEPYSSSVVQLEDVEPAMDDGSEAITPLDNADAAAVPRTRQLMARYHAAREMKNRVLDQMAQAASVRPDIVIHHIGYPGHEIAEMVGAPGVPVCLQPMWVPTNVFRDPHFPLRLPRSLNRYSYFATRMLWRSLLLGRTVQWRRHSLGLPPRKGRRNPLRRPDGEHATVLQAFSRHLLPGEPDYPSSVHTTGFWFTANDNSWQPKQELREFLAADEPPVCVSFGSSLRAGTDSLIETAIKAIRVAGARAVVVGAGGNFGRNAQTPNIIEIDQAPFAWLFPRVSMAIHHGGSGTVGAAMRAGIPQIVCPSLGEHRVFAEQLRRLRVSGDPIPQRSLTAGRLSRAIQRTAHDSEMAERAQKVSYDVMAETGTKTAVELLEAAANGALG